MTALLFLLVVVVVAVLVGIALRRAALPPRISLVIGLLYLAVPGVLAAGGALGRYDPLPAPALVLLLTQALVTVALVSTRAGSLLASSIPLGAVVALQAFRIPVEIVLHRLYVEGVVPVQMTWSGRNFDVVTGLTGLVLGGWILSGRTVPRGVVLAWNVLGLALLANIVTVAALSTPVPFRRFLEGPPNLLPGTFPWIWLPSFLVQVALASHLLVFRKLRQPDSGASRPRAAPVVLGFLAALVLPLQARAAQPPAEVFVLATLYGRHATTPAYDHATLRRLITSVAPKVVVLDVSPRELRDQRVHPSKAEYPEVVFPLVREHGWKAYPGEPDEPAFGEIVGRLGGALKAFREGRPDAARADKGYEEATWAALAAAWHTPADVNGALTDQLIAARRAYQDRTAGPEVAEAWRLWNEHAAAMVGQAAMENPGARILVLIGVENCGPLRRTLAGRPGIRLVDMESFLRARGLEDEP
ncbi:MAG: hypothetical protein ACREMH_01910 [Gemmatimonadales bacterium]